MLSIKIKDIHQCEDTDHVYAIVRTNLGAAYVLVGTMLLLYIVPGS